MFRIFGALLLTFATFWVFNFDAEAQWNKRSCRCDVICTLPNGSTDRSLDKDWNDYYGLPYTSSQLTDCQQKCAGQISASKLNSLANSKKVCGTMTCRANWEVGKGNGKRKGSSGIGQATYNGPECSPGSDCTDCLGPACCAPWQDSYLAEEYILSSSTIGGSRTLEHFHTTGELQRILTMLATAKLYDSSVFAVEVQYIVRDVTPGTNNPPFQVNRTFYGNAVHNPANGWVSTPQVWGNDYRLEISYRFRKPGNVYFDLYADSCEPQHFPMAQGDTVERSGNPKVGLKGLDGKVYWLKVQNSEDPNQSGSQWTNWINSDRPGGSGDFQTIKGLSEQGKICSKPEAIECRTSGTKTDWRKTGEKLTCDNVSGHLCQNKDQTDGRCEDYEVRYLCPVD